jgi:hypothetical protein
MNSVLCISGSVWGGVLPVDGCSASRNGEYAQGGLHIPSSSHFSVLSPCHAGMLLSMARVIAITSFIQCSNGTLYALLPWLEFAILVFFSMKNLLKWNSYA